MRTFVFVCIAFRISSPHPHSRSDPTTSLALSSRNAYLTPHEHETVAPVLYTALQTAASAWESNSTKAECISRAEAVIKEKKREVGDSVDLRLDYIEMNDPESFEVVGEELSQELWEKETEARPIIVSGAMWVGKTRLIDNLVLGARERLGIVA